MKTVANDIYCERGETFTVGFNILNNDKGPYIISNMLDIDNYKSYLLFTIASSVALTTSDRYIVNFWGDTSKIRKFYSTMPVSIDDGMGAGDIWTSINSTYTLPEGITPATFALYYTTDVYGKRTYKTLNGTAADNATFGTYDLKYIKYFSKEITDNWYEQGFDYSLKLVAGPVLVDAQPEDRPIEVEHSYPLVEGKIFVSNNIQGSINAVNN